MLLARHVLPFVDRAIGPSLFPLAVLQVIFPGALVSGPIDVDVDSVSVGLVIYPVAFIDISVNMHKLSMAMSPVIFPLAYYI